MKKLRLTLLSAIFLLILSGCATILTIACEPAAYSGTEFNARVIREAPVGLKLASIIDFLPSLVFDTLSLPYTYPYQKIHENDPPDECSRTGS